MSKFIVTLIYDATESFTIEAESASEAIDIAYGKAEASLCYQCSEHLELGDITDSIVTDEKGQEVKP